MKTNNPRKKGIKFVHEVKAILINVWKHKVEGPCYKTLYINGKTIPVHQDFFGVFDLLSCGGGDIQGHQVSVWEHKSEKIKAIRDSGMIGSVWCRDKDGHKVIYRVIFVDQNGQAMDPVNYKLWHK